MPSGPIHSKVDDKKRERIIEMGEAGKPTALIARKLELTRSTVHYHLVLAGIKAPAERQFDFMRGANRVRSFSSEEDRYLEQLSMEGRRSTDIARLVSERFGHPRKSNTVRIRLVQIANRQEA